jgi:hypothetical protein
MLKPIYLTDNNGVLEKIPTVPTIYYKCDVICTLAQIDFRIRNI